MTIVAIEACEIVERMRDRGMIGPIGLLADRQRPLEQRLDGVAAVAYPIDRGEIEGGVGDVGMVGAALLFA